MKKYVLTSIILMSINILTAQWVSDPAQNTLLATGSSDYGEILLSTNPQSANTYIQWCGSHSNGWSPSIQMVDSAGNPMWGANGIHISSPSFASYSNGVAMAALTKGGCVSGFVDNAGHCKALKINDDGSFAWSANGIAAIQADDCLRTEVVACHNGGFWILTFNDHNIYLRFYQSDGTPGGSQITISDTHGSENIAFGQMVVDDNDNVFVVYMKQHFAYSYYQYKTLCVAKYAINGTQLSQEVQLMNTVAISGQICHDVCPDGLGGGYAWISHPALNDMFEVYVFHFDNTGASTISDPRGLLVGEPDNINFHGMPSASLEPNSHDLLVAFVETDAVTQTHNAIRVNRVTTNGTKLWGPNGNVIVPTTSHNISNLIIDAFPDGTWSSIIYKYDENIVKAVGINSLGTLIWDTTMSTASGNSIALSAASSGYNNHQTIVAWEGTRNGTFGMYGQNLQKNGVMGPVVINDDDSGDDSGDDDSTAVQNFDLNRINIYQTGNCLHIDGQDFQQVEVFSIMGQLILSDNTGKHDIALGGIPQGIYIVRVRTANGKNVNRKVMIR